MAIDELHNFQENQLTSFTILGMLISSIELLLTFCIVGYF